MYVMTYVRVIEARSWTSTEVLTPTSWTLVGGECSAADQTRYESTTVRRFRTTAATRARGEPAPPVVAKADL
jgi:membrane-bound lytic murein transglycosylase MltF